MLQENDEGGESNPPVARNLEKDTLLDLAAKEGRGVDLSSADRLEGWQNVVLRTKDGWILRFPKSHDHAFSRECSILAALSGRLPAEIPVVQWTGRLTRMAAYRTLLGHELVPSQYVRNRAAHSGPIAHSMAQFLVQMHSSFSVAEASEMGIPKLRSQHLIDEVTRRWASVPHNLKAQVDAAIAHFSERWVGDAYSPDRDLRILHNDFHLGNMTFGEKLGPLKAVWDFSCVEVGQPSYEFRYLIEDCWQLACDVASNYHQLSGIDLDLPAAALAAYFEEISDSLVLGGNLALVVTRWSKEHSTLPDVLLATIPG